MFDGRFRVPVERAVKPIGNGLRRNVSMVVSVVLVTMISMYLLVAVELIAAIQGMTFDGQLYGIPYSVENIGLFINTDLVSACPATMIGPGNTRSWCRCTTGRCAISRPLPASGPPARPRSATGATPLWKKKAFSTG